jgi:hypothetical protein
MDTDPATLTDEELAASFDWLLERVANTTGQAWLEHHHALLLVIAEQGRRAEAWIAAKALA